jgi:hypothetical protein
MNFKDEQLTHHMTPNSLNMDFYAGTVPNLFTGSIIGASGPQTQISPMLDEVSYDSTLDLLNFGDNAMYDNPETHFQLNTRSDQSQHLIAPKKRRTVPEDEYIKKVKRREANRLVARKMREKKRNELEVLQRDLASAWKENQRLRNIAQSGLVSPCASRSILAEADFKLPDKFLTYIRNVENKMHGGDDNSDASGVTDSSSSVRPSERMRSSNSASMGFCVIDVEMEELPILWTTTSFKYFCGEHLPNNKNNDLLFVSADQSVCRATRSSSGTGTDNSSDGSLGDASGTMHLSVTFRKTYVKFSESSDTSGSGIGGDSSESLALENGVLGSSGVGGPISSYAAIFERTSSGRKEFAQVREQIRRGATGVRFRARPRPGGPFCEIELNPLVDKHDRASIYVVGHIEIPGPSGS